MQTAFPGLPTSWKGHECTTCCSSWGSTNYYQLCHVSCHCESARDKLGRACSCMVDDQHANWWQKNYHLPVSPRDTSQSPLCCPMQRSVIIACVYLSCAYVPVHAIDLAIGTEVLSCMCYHFNSHFDSHAHTHKMYQI